MGIWFNKQTRKKSTVIHLPEKIKTDHIGFNWLTQFANEVDNSETDIYLDFKNTNWLEGNLCSAIGAAMEKPISKGIRFYCENLENATLKAIFNKNNFELLFGKHPVFPEAAGNLHVKSSVIPFLRFKIENESKFEEYIRDFVFSKNEMPNLSAGATRKMIRSIFELYSNALMHSHSQNVYFCGQLYKGKSRLALTMVDIGDSIKNNVNQYIPAMKSASAKECIEWAVIEGNTTKKQDNAGGLGFSLIRKFLSMNEGKLQIKSDSGYWETKRGIIFAMDQVESFQGTIVNIEFNLKDTNSYITPEENNPFII